jgi:hypothetical protein
VQLAAYYPTFTARTAGWPHDRAPRVLVLQTDGFLSMASGLAFDESGEIRKPPGTQSAQWKARVSRSPLQRTCWGAVHLIGPYYSWSGDYACE